MNGASACILKKFGSAPLASFGTSASSDLPCLSVLPSVPVSNEMLQASVMRGMQTPQRRSVEKLGEAVGRLFKARVELDSKGRVVHLRNAVLNSTLQPLWRDNEVFVRVLKLSDATAKEGKGASVTAAFAVDEEWLEGMTPATVGEAVAVYDVTEKQLAALGFEHADRRWWTYEEREAEAAKSPPSSVASSKSSPDAFEGLFEVASPGGLTTPASAPSTC